MSTANIEPLPEVARLVDLERYPIHHLEGARARELIATWRAEFDRTGACNLQGFVTLAGAAELAAEAEALMPLAYRNTWRRNFMDEMEDDPNLPPDHPAHQFWTTSATQLADDQIGPETRLRQLYEWDSLTEFVASVQRKTKLYRFADEFQALNVIALGDGDHDIWHHDDNECTVTLLLQEPEAGGEFVYGRNTLGPDGSVDLAAVRKLIDAAPDEINRLKRACGTLTLFRGGHSLHGVSPVRGNRKRITAIMTYDPDPGRVSTDQTNCAIYGPRVEHILAERRNRGGSTRTPLMRTPSQKGLST